MIVGWKVHRLTMMQWSNLTECGLFFNIVSPAGPAVHALLPLVLQRLDFLWYRSSHPDPRKSPQLQIWPHRSDRYCFPTKWYFMLGNRKSSKCQIRRIWTLINQFKAIVTHSSHCIHRLVCRSIVLVKQDSWITYPKWLYLERNNAVSIRIDWI